MSQESGRVNQEYLDVLAGIARTIQPDEQSLREWFQRYSDEHKSRLAFDVDIIRKQCRADSRLLEVGSTPPLLTGALKQIGYDVCPHVLM